MTDVGEGTSVDDKGSDFLALASIFHVLHA
jgi:hypothetical protein